MKKIPVLFGLFVWAVSGVWGANPSSEMAIFDAGQNYTLFGIYRVMQDLPVTYAYQVKSSAAVTAGAEEDPVHAEIFEQAAKAAYTAVAEQSIKAWPLQTAEAIRKAGREAEFADLLPLFDQVKVQQLPSAEDARVVFSFSDINHIRAESGHESSCGYSDIGGRPAVIHVMDPNLKDLSSQPKGCIENNSAYDTAFTHSIHEIGHFYGLADQYSTAYNSPLYSNTDRIGRNSMMGASYGVKLDCDDVDGFIKLADRVFYKINKTYTERDEKGWASFCNDGTVYRRGKVLNRTAFFMDWELYQYDAQGNITGKLYLPFVSADDAEITRSVSTGLPEKWVSAQNNTKLAYIYNLGARPSVTIGAYTLQNDMWHGNRNYTKNTAGNFWEVGPYELYINDGQCHFRKGGENALVRIHIYVTRPENTLTVNRSYHLPDGTNNNMTKTDFKDGNFTCDFKSYLHGELVYSYRLAYQKTSDTFTTVRKEIVSARNEDAALAQAEKDCRRSTAGYTNPQMPEEAFAAACNLFEEVEARLKNPAK